MVARHIKIGLLLHRGLKDILYQNAENHQIPLQPHARIVRLVVSQLELHPQSARRQTDGARLRKVR